MNQCDFCRTGNKPQLGIHLTPDRKVIGSCTKDRYSRQKDMEQLVEKLKELEVHGTMTDAWKYKNEMLQEVLEIIKKHYLQD